MSGLRGVQDIHHFSRGDIVEAKSVVLFSELGQIPVEGTHGLPEEHAGILRFGAVGVEFDKDPVGTALHGDLAIQPEAQALDGGRIDGGEVAVFDSRKETEFLALPIQCERALHNE